MSNVIDVLGNTVEWFDIARPEPTGKDFHVQMGVHFEEVHEMVMEVSTMDSELNVLLAKAKIANHELAEYLKRNHNVAYIKTEDELNYLDALCDQIVTAAGCAQVCNYDIVGALEATNKSNFSKFVDGKPIHDENGKIAKGPDYVKVDLRPFLNRDK